MIRYSNYKDSGVDWIGKIPEHWSFLSFRYCIKTLTDFTSNGSFASLAKNVEYQSEGYSRLIRLTDLRVNLENDGIYVSQEAHEFLGNSELFGGELLIANVGAYAGLAEIMPELDFKSTLGPNMFMLRLNQFNPFYYYLLNSPLYSKYISEIANSTAQPKLNKENVRTIQVVKPPLPEQQAIVTYLDEKTTLIDDLIKKKQEKIQLLKEKRTALINHVVTKGLDPEVEMKDSGVEWIGEVPTGWNMTRIKFISKKISKGTTPSTEGKEMVDSGVRFIKAENIKNQKVSETPEFYIDEQTNEILKRSKLEENDILFVIAGATIGKIAILSKDFLPANTNQAISFIRLKQSENHEFLFYWLQSTMIFEQIWLDAVQSAQPNLSMENLGNFSVPYPPYSEQRKIVTYLDEQTQLIDQNIQQEEQKIDLLKEYRQSLISEVVTGKMCVLET
jgi:type I restriction enzyme, S subunit